MDNSQKINPDYYAGLGDTSQNILSKQSSIMSGDRGSKYRVDDQKKLLSQFNSL
jgi:hypothetical protein